MGSSGAAPDTRKRLVAIVQSGVVVLGSFTFLVDLLLLVQPIYMLQVYDRVLVSRSVETLIYTSIIACGALILLGIADTIRAMIASRIAARMQVAAGAQALLVSMNGSRATLGDVQPLRDLASVRSFISNRAILSFLDIPFAPLFIGILYLIHPHLFFIAAGGAVVLVALALLNQMATSRAAGDSGEQAMASMLSAQAFARSAETVNAMGMAQNLIGAWGREEVAGLRTMGRINRIAAYFSGTSRVLRLGLQIAILGYGGYLVLAGEMTAGMIFASSLISGRGLQPIDQVIAGWPGFVEARKSWKRLMAALAYAPNSQNLTELPRPRGRITLEQIIVLAPNAAGAEPLLKRISATIAPGDCVAVVGPSGAGKSTLARTIVGVIRPNSGFVRLDGADISTWQRELLGRHIGYLSQDVDLLPGTVAQNISRFDPRADDAAIVAAAQKAQVHDLILGLSRGYDTVIGPTGQRLSGGQRQRIGLARAFYGDPAILVLDEPNANLDTDGEMALDRALAIAKLQGITAVVVTQRKPMADKADKLMLLRAGAIEDYGPRLDVIARQAEKARAMQAPMKAVQNAPSQVLTGRFGGAAGGADVTDPGTGAS